MNCFNRETIRRAALKAPEPYITRTGVAYVGTKAYDENGKYLGLVIRGYPDGMCGEEGFFASFIPKGEKFKATTRPSKIYAGRSKIQNG